jgi:arsenate reductase (thioredoxin)
MITKKILFLCTGNSARSQIAEGLIREKDGGQIEAYSAGTAPKELNPLAIQVMAEIKIDISHHKSKDVAELMKQSFDWVITVCDHARQQCPIFPGTRIQHWDIPDPENLTDFRMVRDDLAKRIDNFLQQIGVAPAN